MVWLRLSGSVIAPDSDSVIHQIDRPISLGHSLPSERQAGFLCLICCALSPAWHVSPAVSSAIGWLAPACTANGRNANGVLCRQALLGICIYSIMTMPVTLMFFISMSSRDYRAKPRAPLILWPHLSRCPNAAHIASPRVWRITNLVRTHAINAYACTRHAFLFFQPLRYYELIPQYWNILLVFRVYAHHAGVFGTAQADDGCNRRPYD